MRPLLLSSLLVLLGLGAQSAGARESPTLLQTAEARTAKFVRADGLGDIGDDDDDGDEGDEDDDEDEDEDDESEELPLLG